MKSAPTGARFRVDSMEDSRMCFARTLLLGISFLACKFLERKPREASEKLYYLLRNSALERLDGGI